MSIQFKFNHDLNQYIADNNGRITTGNGSIYLPVKLKKGHTYKFDILFNLLSGTATIPTLGSIVQNGKFSAWAFLDSVKALNNVDLPTLGNPTIPHLKPIFIFD